MKTNLGYYTEGQRWSFGEWRSESWQGHRWQSKDIDDSPGKTYDAVELIKADDEELMKADDEEMDSDGSKQILNIIPF